MATRVFFRGPMLFLSKAGNNGVVDEIIIPDCSQPGLHVDRSTARAHTRGILIVSGGQETTTLLAASSRLTIVAEGESNRPVTTSTHLERVFINDTANASPDTDDHLRRIANPVGALTIDLVGGSMSAGDPTGKLLETPRHLAPVVPARHIPVLGTWTAQKSAYYQIDGGPKVPIDPGSEMYVYNWDHHPPTRADLRMPIDSTTMQQPFEDLDMKWVYSLFEPVKGSWDEWLTKGGNGLPVPRTVGYVWTKGFSPPISTCDSLCFVE